MDQIQEYLFNLIADISRKSFCYPTDIATVLSEIIKNSLFPFSGPADQLRIQAFIEEAYHAGLATEEARSLSFHVRYLPDINDFPLNLLNPIPYHVENIVKLAPIASLNSDIVIYVQNGDTSEYPNGLRIVGIGHTIFEDHGMLRQIEGSGSLLPGWHLNVSGPGRFSLFCNIAVIEFIHGKVSCRKIIKSIAPYLEWQTEVIDSALTRCEDEILSFENIGNRCSGQFIPPDFEKAGIFYFKRKAGLIFDCIWTETIKRTRAAGHGGCFLIVPHMVDLKGKGLNVQYRYKKNEEVDILHKMTCWLKDIFNHDNNQIILNNTSLLECDKTIGLLSQLSNVDGAVVISRDFQIIGFGAIIELESEHEYIDMVSQCYDSGYIKCQNKSLNLFGTRHRSAAAFCKKCPGSIAVVVSQDGNVRLMHCANDTVFLWDGFVHSLFG